MEKISFALVLTMCSLLLVSCARTPGLAYSVSGRITDNKGRPIANVTLTTDTSPAHVAVTDHLGRWAITDLQDVVSITPTKPGRRFIPAHRLVIGPNSHVDWTQSMTVISGEPVATLEQARAWLAKRAPHREVLANLYYTIAPDYGIRPDVALAQAVKETGAFRFDGIVQAWQNNFCGLGATGTPSDGLTPLNGADPTRVRFEKGVCGAIFSDEATGVEAHIQHLFAYASTSALPPGTTLLSPRFVYVKRGSALFVEHLGARENPTGVGWAYPGYTYGATLVWDYVEELINFIY